MSDRLYFIQYINIFGVWNSKKYYISVQSSLWIDDTRPSNSGIIPVIRTFVYGDAPMKI